MTKAAAPRFTGWKLRIVLTAGMLAYAGLAWANGMDRLSRSAPTLERLVPPPFRAQANLSAVSVALENGQNDVAVVHANNAVLSDPSNPLALSLLGSTRLLAGDDAGADAAFRVAARGGWRDLITQLYWHDVAANAGDMKLAALRADALLRAHPQIPELFGTLEQLEQSEAGRAALLDRLVLQPDWVSTYFQVADSSKAPELGVKAQMAIGLAANDLPLGCKLPHQLTRILLHNGLRAEAAAVWSASCPDNKLAEFGLADGNFASYAADRNGQPFGWTPHSTADVSVDPVEVASGNWAIQTSNTSAVSKVVLSQSLGLKPGSYRLRANVAANGRPATGLISASISCNGQPSRPSISPDDLASAKGQVLTVASCSRPVLSLWLASGTPSAVTIDNVTLTQISPGSAN